MASKEAEGYLKRLMSDKSISSAMNPCSEVMNAFDAGVKYIKDLQKEKRMIDEEKAEEYASEHEYEYDDMSTAREALYQAYLDGLVEGRNEQRKIFSENCIRCENKKVE